ncbi:MAG: class I SAM-dependent methyltransferase [Sphingobacteriaceae bacterium]|nr:MAG: class I SAM-dependent methyltransferase [Sphingobacteriaceae bacterium]
MDVKEHYDTPLADFYSWMAGSFEQKQQEQQDYFLHRGIVPLATGTAIDLGAGHGIQSVSLVKVGFNVLAIDFSRKLLNELQQNSKGLPVESVYGDIRSVNNYSARQPELIVCAGDTITHLASIQEIEQLIKDCAAILTDQGKLILSFRDYTCALSGDDRFIPVKSDENRILTCCLDYTEDKVQVTDLLYTKQNGNWQQHVSSYYKVRVSPDQITGFIESCGLQILFTDTFNRMITIIVQKP